MSFLVSFDFDHPPVFLSHSLSLAFTNSRKFLSLSLSLFLALYSICVSCLFLCVFSLIDSVQTRPFSASLRDSNRRDPSATDKRTNWLWLTKQSAPSTTATRDMEMIVLNPPTTGPDRYHSHSSVSVCFNDVVRMLESKHYEKSIAGCETRV